MSFKTAILDKLLAWLLESKISPIGWLDGYKTIIGNILTTISGVLAIIQTQFCSIGDISSMCSTLAQVDAVVLFLLSLLVKLVGEWHKASKKIKVLENE